MTRLDPEARRILRTAVPPIRRLLPGLLSGVASGAAIVALLGTSGFLIAYAAEQPPVLYLQMATVGVRAFALSRAVFRYLERLWSHDAVFRQLAETRVDLLERLIPLAPDGLGRTRRGGLLSALVSDVDELQNHSLRVIQPLAIAGTVSLAAVVATWLLSPWAAVVLAVCLVLCGACSTWVSTGIAARAERALAPRRAALNDALIDLLSSLDVLSAFGATDAARRRVDEADRDLTRAVLRRSVGVGVGAAVLSLFSGLAVAGAFLTTQHVVGEGGSQGPVLAVVVLLPIAVFEVVGTVPQALGSWRQVRSSAERLARTAPRTIPAGIPVDEPSAEAPAPRLAGTPLLSLRGLSARWPAAVEPVLHDVDLDVAPGEIVVIEGESGAGKTALAHVLVRFLDHDGAYELDGVADALLGIAGVRELVGLCEQNPYLFDDTLRQNLLFAHDTADEEELLRVLDRVGLREWAEERGGIDARVGERGVLVSGGQAQRIAFARALLRDFPVIVLDEPTAGVDADRGQALLRDILDGARSDGRSVVLITHDEVPPGLEDRRYRMTAGRLRPVADGA